MKNSVFAVMVALGCSLLGCEEPPPARQFATRTMIDVTKTAFTPAPQVAGWPGIALFDYDNDGDIDVFVANSTGLPNMFYQNDGSGNFTFVGAAAGLSLTEESCITPGIGDFDNDGWLDIILTRQATFLGPTAPNSTLLYMKNMGPDENGQVRFEDMTAETGLDRVSFGLSVGVGDIDNDGLLDLYVGRYDLQDLGFADISFLPDTPNVLLRNTRIADVPNAVGGVPVFEDITDTAGVAGTFIAGLAPNTADIMYRAPTWAVLMTDVNEDGLIDIFSLQEIAGGVDLFLNNGDLTFSLAQQDLLNKHGGWMGITAADYDRDGHLDYFLANVGADAKGPNEEFNIANAWGRENGSPFHRLLTHNGDGRLTDVIADTQVTPGILPPTNILGGRGLAAYEFGFGCAWFDMQNDGWPDLHWTGNIILSGVIRTGILRRDFHGVARFMSNNGDGTFTDSTAERGLFNMNENLPLEFGNGDSGRSLAAIDLNGDGFADICRTDASLFPNPSEGMQCLMNPATDDGHWIIVRLEGTMSNRFGIGARVEATCDGAMFVGEVITTTSAFAAVHPQVHFGLGACTEVDSITIRWPSGTVTERVMLSVDQMVTIREE